MSTISTVTDRVDGEVLTAAKYNADHGVNETNATTLNADKVEISNFNTRHGPTGVHSADVVRTDLNLATKDAARFRVVTADHMETSEDAPAIPNIKTLYHDSIIKAWLAQGGTTTPVISGDVNISSIADDGVGVRTPAFATAMADTDYAAISNCDTDGGTAGVGKHSQVVVKNTTSLRYYIVNMDSLTNPTEVDNSANVMIVGKN